MKPDDPELDPALPTTVTPSGRVVFDPLQAARVEVDVPGADEVGQILRELRALEDADAREAVPAPVPLSPSSDGALVTGEGQDAAKAHVEALVPAPSPAGRVDSAPVKVTDLRRLPTARIEKKSPWIVAAEGAEAKIDRAALPSATAPSSRPPPTSVAVGLSAAESSRGRASARFGASGASSSKGRAVLALAGVAATALGVFLVLRASPELPHSGATGSTSFAVTESATAPASTTGADVATTATEPALAGSAMAGTSPEASATATTSAAISGKAIVPGATTATTTATKSTAPRTSGDPYADAGASPKPTASVQPTSAPVVSSAPSVPPVATTAPSVKPSATTTNPWDAPFEKQKKKDSESQ